MLSEVQKRAIYQNVALVTYRLLLPKTSYGMALPTHMNAEEGYPIYRIKVDTLTTEDVILYNGRVPRTNVIQELDNDLGHHSMSG